MKQQTESVEHLVDAIRRRSISAKDTGDDEQWIILKTELCSILHSIASRLAHSEASLSNALQTLQQRQAAASVRQKQMSTVRQELQRSKHLLSIKEQLLQRQQNEVKKLITRNSQLQIQLQEAQQKMITTKPRFDKLPATEADQLQAMAGSSLTDFRLRPCSNQHKQGRQLHHNHQSDLEIAKLKNEVSKLQDQNRVLRVELQLLKIDNAHLAEQGQISSCRQRELYANMVELLSGQTENNQIQTWSDKCSQISLFVDRVTEEKFSQKPTRASNRYQFPHPPTPHFSSSTGFCFAKQPKLVSTTAETIFPLEELSLGEGDICFSDSCPPSV